jgi:hypothetical protein
MPSKNSELNQALAELAERYASPTQTGPGWDKCFTDDFMRTVLQAKGIDWHMIGLHRTFLYNLTRLFG